MGYQKKSRPPEGEDGYYKSEPTVFSALDWWFVHIDSVDPGWQHKVLDIYDFWLMKFEASRRDKRKFISNFLSDTEQELYSMSERIARSNRIVKWDWSSRFSYIMTMFYWLLEVMYEERT